MKLKTRIALIGFLGIVLILVFWNFKGKIEDFLFFEITKNQNLEKPNLEKYYATFKPFRNWEVPEPEIKSLAAVSVAIDESQNRKFLFLKNSKETLPIASITKLMTAKISIENYNLSDKITISAKASFIERTFNNLKIGETFYVKDLLHSLLMESNNVAAQAFSESIGEIKFVELMNQKAKEIGMENTYFSNPTGLDPDYYVFSPNYSTAEDLINLASFLLEEPLVWEISGKKEFELYETNGIFHHKIENNNELLSLSLENGWETKIVGGKTGQTPLAKECLLIVLKGPRQNYIINIILGAKDRFEEMKKLTDWVYKAYKW